MQAISIQQHGGPDVLVQRDVNDPLPGPGEVVVRVAAAGLNYIDVYHRTGHYDVDLPFIPGVEAAGTVADIGPEVAAVTRGDRVAWVMETGAYAEFAAVRAERLMAVPDDIDLRTAAAAMLQGLTAHYLTESVYRVSPGDSALVHAAAGGVGQLLVQMLVRRGARVLATASTAEKLEIARGMGADVTIPYTEVDFGDQVLEATGGRGVDVVYDGVGRATFGRGLEILRRRGMMALFGGSSGPVEPVDPLVLAQHGSLFLTRPSLGDYVRDAEELHSRARDLFLWLRSGDVEIMVDRSFALRDAPVAHEYLEGRNTRGKVLLLPSGD